MLLNYYYNYRDYAWQEDDKSWSIQLPVPGVKKQDIDVDVRYNTLSVSFKGNEFISDQDVTFKLPSNIDSDGISAKVNDGVLEIIIDKPRGYSAKVPVK